MPTTSIKPNCARPVGTVLATYLSSTAHEVNKIVCREGQFWLEDYFDRYIRNAKHFQKTVEYIENNPVKAGLCKEPSDWPYSSARFKKRWKNNLCKRLLVRVEGIEREASW